MADIKSNGYVRWLGLLTVLIPTLGGMFWFNYSIAKDASDDTVSSAEFIQFEKRFDHLVENQLRIENAISDLAKELHHSRSGPGGITP